MGRRHNGPCIATGQRPERAIGFRSKLSKLPMTIQQVISKSLNGGGPGVEPGLLLPTWLEQFHQEPMAALKMIEVSTPGAGQPYVDLVSNTAWLHPKSTGQ